VFVIGALTDRADLRSGDTTNHGGSDGRAKSRGQPKGGANSVSYRVGDVQPLVRVGDVDGSTVEGDGAGERAAEPCGKSEVVQTSDDCVAL
jgi:hypothetical protein